MTEPRQLATVRCWKDIPAAIRAAIDERKTTCSSVDEVCGLPAGYTAKLTGPVPLRGLGETSFDALLCGLGVMMVLIEDPQKAVKFQERLDGREEWRVTNARMHSGAVHIRVSRRKLRRMAKKGGANSRKNMSKTRAKRIAKYAANARWERRRARLLAIAARREQAALPAPSANPLPSPND